MCVCERERERERDDPFMSKYMVIIKTLFSRHYHHTLYPGA